MGFSGNTPFNSLDSGLPKSAPHSLKQRRLKLQVEVVGFQIVTALLLNLL